MSRGGARPGAGRKPNDNYPRKYYTDAKTHDTIQKIVEANRINKVQSANLSKCEKEALKCKHQNIKTEYGLSECLDCGVRNY